MRPIIKIQMALAILLTGCGVSSSVHQATLKNLDSARSDLERLRDQNTTLKSEVAAREAIIQDLRRQINEIENKRQIQSRDSERLVNRNLELVAESSNLSSQIRDLSQTLEAREQELEQIRSRIAAQEKIQEQFKEKKAERIKMVYDQLAVGLQADIKKGTVSITQGPEKLSVHLVEGALFKVKSADIKPTGQKLLDRIGAILKSDPNIPIRIEGYTDNVPPGSRRKDKFRTNWDLSAARAVNVVRYLSGAAGLPSERMSAVAFAQNHPIASNKTKDGRARNRRIEMVLFPIEADSGLQESNSPTQAP